MSEHTRLNSYRFNNDTLVTDVSPSKVCGTLYRLTPKALHGYYHSVSMPSMHLTFIESCNGLLHAIRLPEDTLSVAAIIQGGYGSCIGKTKYGPLDVVILGENEQILYDKSDLRLAMISFHKQKYRKLTKLYEPYKGYVLEKNAPNIGSLLYGIFEQINHQKTLLDNDAWLHKQENKIADILLRLLEGVPPYRPKLTKGEAIAVDIRDRVYHHIEPDITIKNFADEYGVTEQTLQNAFKSIFDMTPHRFLRAVKLNHVRQDLLHSNPQTTTVIDVATKWGFTHMGHFSGYYKKLFGENPSVTLKRTPTVSMT